jgi:hypothetical protein
LWIPLLLGVAFNCSFVAIAAEGAKGESDEKVEKVEKAVKRSADTLCRNGFVYIAGFSGVDAGSIVINQNFLEVLAKDIHRTKVLRRVFQGRPPFPK